VPRQSQALKATAALLADVEAELGRSDAADDQIGAHAEDAEQRLVRELASRRKHLDVAGNDPDAEAEYLYLSGHLRRARQVAAMARRARERR